MEIDFFIGFLLSRKKFEKKFDFLYTISETARIINGGRGKGTIFFGIKRFNLERKRKKLLLVILVVVIVLC